MAETDQITTPSFKDLAEDQARVVAGLQREVLQALGHQSIQSKEYVPALAVAIDKLATLNGLIYD